MTIGRETKRAFDADRRAMDNAFGSRDRGLSNNQSSSSEYSETRETYIIRGDDGYSRQMENERLNIERERLHIEQMRFKNEQIKMDNEFFNSNAGKKYLQYQSERNREIVEAAAEHNTYMSTNLHNHYLSRFGIAGLFFGCGLSSIISEPLSFLLAGLLILYTFVYITAWIFYKASMVPSVKIRPEMSRNEAIVRYG